MKYFRIVVSNSDYKVPVFILFKRDIWEKLYDVDESVLLEEIETSIFNNETEGNFSLLFVEILSAYDESTVTIETENGEKMTFEKPDIALIRLAFDF